MRCRRPLKSTATLCLTLLSAGAAEAEEPGDGGPLLLEPTVRRHAGVLPPEACRELIALGEEEGFDVDEESIDDYEDERDRAPSQSIEVYNGNEGYDGVDSPAIWKALQPWIPRLTELVKQSIDQMTDSKYFPDTPDRTPKLGWVFFRKYSPDSARKSLKLHVDSNMHTLNIALNDDFEGGGLFYVKPRANQEFDADDRPDVRPEYLSYGFVNSLERRNGTGVVFPALNAGDVLVHNFTVWHAVAPIRRGTRYSFVLFYDMHNPAIQDDFYKDDDEEDSDDAFAATFYHKMEGVRVDLAFVYRETNDDGEEQGDEIAEVMGRNMEPFQMLSLATYEGRVFRAFVSGTETAVLEFEMTRDRPLYKIEMEDALVGGGGLEC